MANPTGAVFGAVSLATSLPATFVAVVECFEYMELSRHFDKDFNKSQARLEALKLQITRFGISSGVLSDPQTGEHRRVLVDSKTAETAERLLDTILDDIQELERKSKRYSNKSGAPGSTGSTHLQEIDSQTQGLISNASKIFAKRIRGVALQKRAKWALYEKLYFDRLLEDITKNLNLLMLIPKDTDYQHQLCRMEVEEIQVDQPSGVMELLHDASKANNDALLEQALREAFTNTNSGHSWERVEVTDNVQLEQGDRIANGFAAQVPINRGNHRFGTTIGRGNAKIRQGDNYGPV